MDSRLLKLNELQGRLRFEPCLSESQSAIHSAIVKAALLSIAMAGTYFSGYKR